VAELLALRERAEQDPGKRRALVAELGRLYAGPLGAPAEAVRWLERGLELAPEEPQILEPLADAYYQSGRVRDAASLYQRLLAKLGARKSKEVARVQFRLGAIAETERDPARALEHYSAAFAIDPTHGGTMAALGRLYSAAQDWEKARKVFRSMLLQNLDADAGVSKADVYFMLGQIHARLGEGPKARNMFERGLELDPTHSELKQALAGLG
jgi:pentatricopeptide repeat protein